MKAAEAVTLTHGAADGPAAAASTGAALEALALAASVAGAPVFRGALILERGRMLEQLGLRDAAAAAAEAALALLRRQALPGGGVPAAGSPGVRALQRWVLGRLLRAARLLHGLGREAAAAEVLEPLPAAAAALGDAATYVAAVGQLGSPSDHLLLELQRCSTTLEAGAADDAAAAVDGSGAPDCPWLRGFNASRAFPLFYALHRGLHARR